MELAAADDEEDIPAPLALLDLSLEILFRRLLLCSL
jgi:hypothetical protein